MPAEVAGMVSVIIPVFNRAGMLAEAVASVLQQDYSPVELIIVNDGSTDETFAAAEAIVAIHPGVARVLHIPNGGPGVAREAGRRIARGEFIQYLDSDDLLLEGKFSRQVAALEAEPDTHVAYGQTRFLYSDGTTHPGPWKGSGERFEAMFPSFLQSRWWDTPNPLYRRRICDAAGPWLTTRVEEDWEYDCRIASLGARLAYVPAFVCEVRDHADHRLSRVSAPDPSWLRDRATSHILIFHHARRAGLTPETPEMQHFARELFLLARQCGAGGLDDEASMLFDLARAASTPLRSRAFDFRLYALAAATLGWSGAGRLAARLDELRSR